MLFDVLAFTNIAKERTTIIDIKYNYTTLFALMKKVVLMYCTIVSHQIIKLYYITINQLFDIVQYDSFSYKTIFKNSFKRKSLFI